MLPPRRCHNTVTILKLRLAITEAHALGLKVFPWTVNSPGEMARLIDMKVDGLISDYPDRLRNVMSDKGLAPP